MDQLQLTPAIDDGPLGKLDQAALAALDLDCGLLGPLLDADVAPGLELDSDPDLLLDLTHDLQVERALALDLLAHR